MSKHKHHIERGRVMRLTRKDKHGMGKGAVCHLVMHDSVSDLVLDGANPCEMTDEERSSRREATDSRKPWQGTRTYEEGVELATHGWSKGRHDAEVMADIMEGQVGVRSEPTFVTKMAAFGARPSIPHYLAGDPECMVDYQLTNVERTGRLVRMFLDVGGSAGFKPKVFMARASAVLALIETLNRQGDQVELHAGHMLYPPGGNVNGPVAINSTLVHAAGAVLDPDAVAFACGHPSMLRRVSFAIEECMSSEFRKAFGVYKDGTYGRSEDNQQRMEYLIEKYLEPETGPFDIVIGSLNVGAKIKVTDKTEALHDWNDVGQRTDWIKTQLLDLGFEMED